MSLFRSILAWFGQHPTVVIVTLVCVAAVITVAIVAGRDVAGFFQMVAGWFGA